MFFVTKNSSLKAIFVSSVSRRLYRGLSTNANPAEKDQQENDEKKAVQQKYQELEKLQYRPLYLDAQATTPMVSFIYSQVFSNQAFFFQIQDPRVLDQMLPYMTHLYGNPHSRTHAFGWETEKAVEDAREVTNESLFLFSI